MGVARKKGGYHRTCIQKNTNIQVEILIPGDSEGDSSLNPPSPFQSLHTATGPTLPPPPTHSLTHSLTHTHTHAHKNTHTRSPCAHTQGIGNLLLLSLQPV
ncbi:hypothetical protein CHARACLAT_021050 [Characodon lateralis]|uniref:Uncharacterized protein n=1 Tax=Characodon lateralis TaxID=208331 RepID=A0ABU7D1Q8_9TELE|nr:hypothetical protein [Characodon lateralis]